MTNILFLHNGVEISGGERSLLCLWQKMDRSLFSPIVVLPANGAFSKAACAAGVPVEILSVPSLGSWWTPAFAAARKSLEQLVQTYKIEIIHSYAPRNNVLACLARNKMHVSVIWHERNLLYGGEFDVSQLLLSWPDALVCNSRAVAARFSNNNVCPQKVSVIHNGVDIDCFSPCSKEEKENIKIKLGWQGRRIVGLVSNLNPRKGVEDFLRIAADLGKKDSQLFFVVVGGVFGDIRAGRLDELRALSRKLGIGGQVFFTEFVDDVQMYLKTFDVFCAVTRQEACSRAILEAMATGIPVVAVNEGGNSELIEDGANGVLVPPDDLPGFSSALWALLSDEKKQELYGVSARRRIVSCFNVQVNESTMCALYTSLMRTRRNIACG